MKSLSRDTLIFGNKTGSSDSHKTLPDSTNELVAHWMNPEVQNPDACKWCLPPEDGLKMCNEEVNKSYCSFWAFLEHVILK